jgi:hypothetical protein
MLKRFFYTTCTRSNEKPHQVASHDLAIALQHKKMRIDYVTV